MGDQSHRSPIMKDATGNLGRQINDGIVRMERSSRRNNQSQMSRTSKPNTLTNEARRMHSIDNTM